MENWPSIYNMQIVDYLRIDCITLALEGTRYGEAICPSSQMRETPQYMRKNYKEE